MASFAPPPCAFSTRALSKDFMNAFTCPAATAKRYIFAPSPRLALSTLLMPFSCWRRRMSVSSPAAHAAARRICCSKFLRVRALAGEFGGIPRSERRARGRRRPRRWRSRRRARRRRHERLALLRRRHARESNTLLHLTARFVSTIGDGKRPRIFLLRLHRDFLARRRRRFLRRRIRSL